MFYFVFRQHETGLVGKGRPGRVTANAVLIQNVMLNDVPARRLSRRKRCRNYTEREDENEIRQFHHHGFNSRVILEIIEELRVCRSGSGRADT